MRELTIFRKKKMVASIMKLYVFVQKFEGEEIAVTKENCINQGFMKNGKSLSIKVPEEAFYIYVTYDKKLPKTYFTKHLVNTGTDPVELITFAKYDPFKGNPLVIMEKTG